MTNHFAGFRNMLVATDLSKCSEAALKQAAWLAQRSPAKITLAHALQNLQEAVHSSLPQSKLDLLPGEGEIFQQEVHHLSERRMCRIIADLDASELEVRCETLLGEPFVELTRAVQSTGYDLVLAGTRGLAGWEQFFVGSTAKRLIRKCPASVWIVKAEHVGPPKSVLATTDFSEVSLKAVSEGLWVAQQAAAEFHLLHVIPVDVREDMISKIPQGDALRKEIYADAKARLDDLVATLRPAYDKIQIHLRCGTPWQEVGRLAKDVSADLIAIGTVGRSGIRGMLLGNTAERVLATCDCSILTVKPLDFVSPI